MKKDNRQCPINNISIKYPPLLQTLLSSISRKVFRLRDETVSCVSIFRLPLASLETSTTYYMEKLSQNSDPKPTGLLP